MNFLNFMVLIYISFLQCSGYKILFLAPFNGKSHFMYTSAFARKLLDRGHEVTYLTSISMNQPNLVNYTEILIDPPQNMSAIVPPERFIQVASQSLFKSIDDMKYYPTIWNTYALANANVQKFIKATGLHYDIIVVEEFFIESFYMFAHKHKAPIVTICSIGAMEFLDAQQGLFQWPSFVPHWMLPFSDEMSFTQRWYNTMLNAYSWFVRHYSFLPSEERLAKKHFAHLAPLPPLYDIIRNVSLVLVNYHRAISPPRPFMPNVVPIGGAHIRAVQPLPNDLKQFLDEARDGAIYFSLGTVLQSSTMPRQLIQSFLNTFKSLKQRVLWKYEDESLDEIPSNVMIRKWMPQNDILAHPNVILFIGHGGMFGTMESLYHGVPLMSIPFFGDQFRNAIRIDASGFGKFIQHRDITVETFSNAINEIISNKSYSNKVKDTSMIFKDNLVHPMDEAMYWIEYVAKFKGAKHLKSHATYMSWFTYLCLDVILVNLLVVSVILLVIYTIFKKLVGSKSKKVSDKKNE